MVAGPAAVGGYRRGGPLVDRGASGPKAASVAARTTQRVAKNGWNAETRRDTAGDVLLSVASFGTAGVVARGIPKSFRLERALAAISGTGTDAVGLLIP